MLARPGGAPAEFRRHWRALAGCTVGAAIGTIGLHAYTGGAFVAALTGDDVFTRTQLSLATFLLSICVALLSPLVGAIMDRVGALRVIALSVLGEATAFALLSLVPARFPLFAGAVVVLAVLGAGTTPPGFARIVTARFDRGRGLALGVMISGLGLMAMGAPIWANWAIGAYGWRGGYRVVAGVVLVLGGMGAGLIRMEEPRTSPDARTVRSDGGDWSALRRPLFWAIFTGFLAAALFGGGYLLHMITLLHQRGFTTAQAARVQGLIGLAVLAGRLGSGAALDRFRAQRVAAAAFVASASGYLLLLSSASPAVALGAFAVGLTIGSELDILAYMISRHFGLASFGRLYGFCYGGMIMAGGLSPLWISLAADRSGYALALVVSTVGTLLAAVLVVRLPSPPRDTTA